MTSLKKFAYDGYETYPLQGQHGADGKRIRVLEVPETQGVTGEALGENKR